MKKMNNKTLAIIFAVILALFIGTKVFRASSQKTNMRTQILTVAKEKITKIEIHPHSTPGKTVSLQKTSSGWQVLAGTSSDKTQNGTVEDLLPVVSQVNATRLVSRKKSDWDTYGVGDTSGTHVILYHQSSPLADFWVGAGDEANGKSATYLRMQGHNEVYQVSAGYLASSLDKSFDGWRDPSFLRITSAQITRVAFAYPRDTGFTLKKTNGAWSIGGVPADSNAVVSYLDKLSYQSLHHFVHHFTPPANPTMEISVGNDSAQLAVIDAWKTDSLWTLSASTRAHAYFSSEGSDIIRSLFVGKASLLGK